ncbi:hypothetical protein E0485_13175 [Paenibacillus albiflavus]|uniref:Uncharacterized protein n=1 Tax=Paenibacillus albiflavus TaxID=2545760 RepID=A0A4R4EEQ3_9BACL|nr:hypothetical protein E0485_13175 [Paenibacillus albiflavus]
MGNYDKKVYHTRHEKHTVYHHPIGVCTLSCLFGCSKSDLQLRTVLLVGPVAEASIKSGRIFKGFEVDPHYCSLAQNRTEIH